MNSLVPAPDVKLRGKFANSNSVPDPQAPILLKIEGFLQKHRVERCLNSWFHNANLSAMLSNFVSSLSMCHTMATFLSRHTAVPVQIGIGALLIVLLSPPALKAQSSPLEDLVRNIREEGVTEWQLSYSRDAYMGGEVNRSSRQVIRLLVDRSVEWEHLGKRQSGTWSVDPAGGHITFVFTHAEGAPLGDKSYQADFLLEAYADGQMVMSQQGRHGPVERVYQQIVAGD